MAVTDIAPCKGCNIGFQLDPKGQRERDLKTKYTSGSRRPLHRFVERRLKPCGLETIIQDPQPTDKRWARRPKNPPIVGLDGMQRPGKKESCG